MNYFGGTRCALITGRVTSCEIGKPARILIGGKPYLTDPVSQFTTHPNNAYQIFTATGAIFVSPDGCVTPTDKGVPK
jgi:hypothetical protein